MNNRDVFKLLKTVGYDSDYIIISMLACINKWIILQRTKITISPVPFKSLLRTLAPVKYISKLRHTKNFKKFWDLI